MNTVALDEQILRKNREFIEFFVARKLSHQTKCPPGSVEMLSALTAAAQADWDRIRHYQYLPVLAGTIYRTIIEVVSQTTAAAELAMHFSTIVYRSERESGKLDITEYESKAVEEHDRLTRLLSSIAEVLLRENEHMRSESFKSETVRYGLALHVAELLTSLTRALDKHAIALELSAAARTRLGETLLAQARSEEEESAKKSEQLAKRKALRAKNNKNH